MAGEDSPYALFFLLRSTGDPLIGFLDLARRRQIERKYFGFLLTKV